MDAPKITASIANPGITIDLDGQPVTGVRVLHAHIRESTGRPVLVLELDVERVTVNGEIQAQVTEPLRASLVALGWTPPTDEEAPRSGS
ncbi:hypothetical protein [Umezawaea tangerina]|uniref:Uncharacterized protein n=1 Tax=Umezawaea tangerina TaxID=84725 RepID=A0A2T0TCB6_9PSEU|nr:hypothetical protein [Umezawaea tangerina]PRY43299.1 hypothetical protein CLV43_10339 [Umezawaea tangerina]